MWRSGIIASVALVGLFTSSSGLCQDTPTISAPPVGAAPGNLLDQYRARELHTRFAWWRGQELYRGDKPVQLGYFGGNSQDIFAGSPAALDSMSTFRTVRITGTTAYVVGLALMVTDLFLLGTSSNSVVSRNAQGEVTGVKPLYLGLLFPGAVLSLSGAIAMQGANGYLSDAIDQYNSDLTKQLKGSSAMLNQSRFIGYNLRGLF